MRALRDFGGNITVDIVNRYKDTVNVGDRKRVKELVISDYNAKRYLLNDITVAKKLPHFIIDTDGKCWKYIDLLTGEMEKG